MLNGRVLEQLRILFYESNKHEKSESAHNVQINSSISGSCILRAVMNSWTVSDLWSWWLYMSCNQPAGDIVWWNIRFPFTVTHHRSQNTYKLIIINSLKDEIK